MDDPPPEVQSLEQLNEWRINERELGARKFARVLKDGIFLCKYGTNGSRRLNVNRCIVSLKTRPASPSYLTLA